jgi:LmbE family N-acetylglucosaminyl deacetylase
MLTFVPSPAGPPDRPFTLLALGAHCDDLEIGAGGTLLALASAYPGLRAHVAILTSEPDREAEARASAAAFLAGADVTVQIDMLPDGYLPARWEQTKQVLQVLAARMRPDLVLAPSATDAHQDHRTIAELVPTAFRDHLVLGYEIPKWDGDLSRPSVYVPLTDEQARTKCELLHKFFPSQHGRDWFDDEVFLGLARLRGMECRSRYAEAFSCAKATLSFGPFGPGTQR